MGVTPNPNDNKLEGTSSKIDPAPSPSSVMSKDISNDDNESAGPSGFMKEVTVVVERDGGDDSISEAVIDYFQPIVQEFDKKLGLGLNRTLRVDASFLEILKNVFEFTWGPDFFKSSRWALLRMYKEISLIFDVTEEQSDLEDLLMYHPIDAISSKFTQAFFTMAMIEPDMFRKNFGELQKLLRTLQPKLDHPSREACAFVYKSLKQLYEILAGQKPGDGEGDDGDFDTTPPGQRFNDLSREAKAILVGMKSSFIRWFRARAKERFLMLKEAHEGDPTNVEWVIFLAQSLRAGRREQVASSISKKPTFDELEFVDLTMKMEPNNPFVRLGVIECVVDAVREFNGRFFCGEINLQDMGKAMEFLRKECELICEDFPRNVQFKGIVSDYFARFVPLLYFDKEFSGSLLKEMYELNPRNPKTTHRLGIFHRMNMKNMAESLKWLEKTIEIDPSHYTSNIDYFKIILGKTEEYPDSGDLMVAILNDESKSGGWRINEKAEFQFYTGLAIFASGKKEEALKLWMEILSWKVEKSFALTDVDADTSFFKWDVKRINAEKIRLWIYEEFTKIQKGQVQVDDDTKKYVTKIFQLMFNLVNPVKPGGFDTPYSEFFTRGFPTSVLGVLVPDRK